MEPVETPYERGPGYPEHYRDRRFAVGTGPRTWRREVRAVSRLLSLVPEAGGPWLDMPSGTGRLSSLLPSPVVQVDRARAMLAASPVPGARVCASASRLPFAPDTFAGALCFRLLHHIPDAGERVRILAELARVTRGPVLVSYFDAASAQHVRRVLRRALGRPSRRVAVSWRQLRGDLRRAGLAPETRVRLRPWLSEQTVVLARRV